MATAQPDPLFLILSSHVGCATFQVEEKLDLTEKKLPKQPEDLLKDIESLKNKTELNREMARESREAADFAKNMTDQMVKPEVWISETLFSITCL